MERLIRFFDLLFSMLGILALLPLFIPICAILRLTGEGKILYIQQRVGQNRKLFGLVKFATMLEDSPNMGSGDITIRNDPRILPLGRFLRKTKINELPQLFNIFKGDMTFVGFRPHTQNALKHFDDAQIKVVTKLKPGLTGYGSLEFSDEESLLPDDPDEAIKFYKSVIVPRKVFLEEKWIKDRSIKVYFLIIFSTIFKVLLSKKR